MTARYDVHGVGIAVDVADSELLAAVHGRLRHFAVAGRGVADLRFEYAVDPLAAARPHGPARPASRSAIVGS